MVPELPFEIVKSTKLAISVHQKQKDNSAFDKGGATQRTRQSIYATAVAACFFFFCFFLFFFFFFVFFAVRWINTTKSDQSSRNHKLHKPLPTNLRCAVCKQLSAGSSEPKLLVHAIGLSGSVSRPMLS